MLFLYCISAENTVDFHLKYEGDLDVHHWSAMSFSCFVQGMPAIPALSTSV